MNLSYLTLLDEVKAYHPGKYHSSRNYINGAVTAWSPYISRGFLSPVKVMEELKGKYNKQEWIGFLQQMAWREYFQRVWQHKGDLILQDLKSTQLNVVLKQVPLPISNALTGIRVLDDAIGQLYEKGYLHNHLRMYLAMLHSNIFKAAWLPGAKWMYAHLLDHDPAANFLSWQWVAGTFSSKQYVANQDNINKYTSTNQVGTFLDTEYENLHKAIFDTDGQPVLNRVINLKAPFDQPYTIDTSSILKNIIAANSAQKFDLNKIDLDRPVCVYNSFNLDPLWHADQEANRILLLEPDHFTTYPVTENVLQFIVDLAKKNLPHLQIFVGSFEALLVALNNSKGLVYFKEHPTTAHYKGIREERDWLFPEVNGYYPSFFGFWKKCEKILK